MQGAAALADGQVVRVGPPGETDAMTLDADGLQARRGLLRCGLAAFVRVKRQSDALDLRRLDRLEQLVGEVLRAKSAGRRLHPVTTERQRIDHAFAEDDFVMLQRVGVEHSGQRAGQVEMPPVLGRPGIDAPSIKLKATAT